jgi:predicted ATP-binding protein involved in virulence
MEEVALFLHAQWQAVVEQSLLDESSLNKVKPQDK